MSHYPSNSDHYKRRSGKGRRQGRGYGQNCWRQRNPNVYAYNQGYGDNRYEYEPHMPFEGSWVEDDVLRWLQSDNRSWNNQRVGNNWQHQNRIHHGASSISTLRPINHLNSAEPSQNQLGSLKVNNSNVSTESKNVNEKPVSAAQQPPPPGSEEARLEAIANTTDKLRQCLFSNKNKNSEVLKTFLSSNDDTADPKSMKESAKIDNLVVPVPQPDLPPSPTDWQKICMSSRPKSPNSLLVDDDDDVVFVAKPTVETVSIDSDDSISGDMSVIHHKIKTEKSDSSLSTSSPITDIASRKTCSNLKDNSGNSKDKDNNLSSDSPCIRPLSPADNENSVGSLKQNVVRQLLKMGAASIKDIVNNPTSRKFQYALKHLVREHKVAWTRQLRILAETRIQNRNREIINHEHLLDSDIAVNISNLPQEFIEQLGDLLKMDLFDTVDFQDTNTDDAEQGLRDLELLCSEVTQEAEKAFNASKNSSQDSLIDKNLPGQINSFIENNINSIQEDTLNVHNIKHEKLDSDVNLNTPNVINHSTKYPESSVTQKYEAINSEHSKLKNHAEDHIDTLAAKDILLASDSEQNSLNHFQPIEARESEKNNLIVKNAVLDIVNQSNSFKLHNSALQKNIEAESQAEINEGFTEPDIPNSLTKDKEDCRNSSKVGEISVEEERQPLLNNEKIVNEEVDEADTVNSTYCTDKSLEITRQDYDEDSVLNIHSQMLNEAEITEQAEDSRDSNSIPEQTHEIVALSSSGDNNTVMLGGSLTTSDFQPTSKRICTPAAKKCYSFNSLGVSVCTQTEPSPRKFYASEIISELENVYHLPGLLLAILKEYLEPNETNVPKPQPERSFPPPHPIIVSKSFFNKLDSKGTSNTCLPPSEFEQWGLPRKSAALSDTCSDQVNNEETSQVRNQYNHSDNEVDLNILMNPNSSNLPCKGSVVSSCRNINSDESTAHENTYLKMFEIDCKIHQLMGKKIDLYKQLQLSFLSQQGNHLNSRTSYGSGNPQAENLRIDHCENNQNIIRVCGGIKPISDLENPLTSDTFTSQRIPSHEIGTESKNVTPVLEVLPNHDTRESDYTIHTSLQWEKNLDGREGTHTSSNSPKSASPVENNHVSQCPVVGNSNSSSSIQSFQRDNCRKKSKNIKQTKRKSLLKSVLLLDQNMPDQVNNEETSQTIMGEMCTDDNVDKSLSPGPRKRGKVSSRELQSLGCLPDQVNEETSQTIMGEMCTDNNVDKSLSPGPRKRGKVSSRELQSLGCLLNAENNCSTVTIKTEVSDSDAETNNVGRIRKQRYSLLDEKLLESQVYNMDKNMPHTDRKRKSILMCDSEATDTPHFKKTRNECPQVTEKPKEPENMCVTTNIKSEEKLSLGNVFSDEFPQKENANKLCQLPVSVVSMAAVENNSIKTERLGSSSNSEPRSTVIPCTDISDINAFSETSCSMKRNENSENSNAKISRPYRIEVLSKIRKCSVVLERLPKNILCKSNATACLENSSENLTNLSAEPLTLENVPSINSMKPFCNTDDKDEDTNSVSSVSGGGTPRRLCGPDDCGEVEVRNRLVGHKGSILDLQCIGRFVLAACEDGCVYCYSLKSGKLKRTLHCSESPVTCLCISDSASLGLKFIFCGSLDGYLRCFTFEKGDEVNEPIYVGSGIQCVEHNWGNIYIGTKDGSVKVFNCKKFEILTNYFECSKDSVFTIRTTKEGPRKVMLIGSRSQPVIVRDSATGLYLRSVTKESNFTVYSILLDSSLVYCGTSIGTIPVYNFTNGEEVFQFSAGTGVVCMKIYNDLLFAGCYDGFIYIFNIQGKNLITKVSGSGKMILSLEISKNRIICSSKDKTLEVWNFPLEVRKYLKDTKHR